MKKFLKALGALFLIILVWIFSGCQPEDAYPQEMKEDGFINGHGYVDLGLPSGTMWATCNVGAALPEKHGDYFAWGETEPKMYYSYDSYKYYRYKDWTTICQLTKYCNDPENGYHGYSDTLSALQPDDDAATVNWGEGWQTPTADQWRELLEYAFPSRTCINGVNGLLFHGMYGTDKLFIPAAGYKYHLGDDIDELLDSGECLMYWSNTLNTDTLEEWPAPSMSAWLFIVYDGYDSYVSLVEKGERHIGCPVRPVCTAP